MRKIVPFHSIPWLSKCHLFESKKQLFLFILVISSFWKNDLSKIFCAHIFEQFFRWMKSKISGLLLEISFFKKLPRYQVIQRKKAKPFKKPYLHDCFVISDSSVTVYWTALWKSNESKAAQMEVLWKRVKWWNCFAFGNI